MNPEILYQDESLVDKFASKDYLRWLNVPQCDWTIDLENCTEYEMDVAMQAGGTKH